MLSLNNNRHHIIEGRNLFAIIGYLQQAGVELHVTQG
jgi:hypothetical protein